MSSGGRSDATLEEPAAKLPDEPIVFENMSFHHAQTGDGLTEPSDEHGVRDLNLTIARGEFIGITGSSGAGKSTFCDLLVGLFPPKRGRYSLGLRYWTARRTWHGVLK
jgi:ABC-type multidrug transport system fused ATPase/permease subunit